MALMSNNKSAKSGNKNAKQVAPAKSSNTKNTILGVIAIAVIAIAVFTMTSNKGADDVSGSTPTAAQPKTAAKSVTDANGDMVIPVAEVSENATFYSYDEAGTTMEVIAIKASDGSIRTAFNTCQVCFDSGKGYYVQQGDVLVCQNCGNEFTADQVEVTKGGCNPVPINDGDKTVTDTSIVIGKAFFEQSQNIFANWKI